uniref:Olfactory receptor family 6 subfamily F member 2 n=1 Tax=Nannospalax galili TaxID=1026970 RepID=A0A8C6QVR6_NANGA
MAWSTGQNLFTPGLFILLGFPGPRVSGNMAIISLVGAHRYLQTPMYFFLCNHSFLEIWFTTACVPKTLATFISWGSTISLAGCAIQMYFVFSLGCTEYFLLAVVAYDCYLAICLPLRYGGIMTPGLAVQLALGSWLCSFSAITVAATLITCLSFCDLCVIYQLVLMWCHTGLYAYIIITIIRIPLAQGRHCAFFTCSSHLTVVLIWYGSTIFLHWSSLDLTKAVTVLNTIVTSVLNPFIYTLRNKDVKEALCRMVQGN